MKKKRICTETLKGKKKVSVEIFSWQAGGKKLWVVCGMCLGFKDTWFKQRVFWRGCWFLPFQVPAKPKHWRGWGGGTNGWWAFTSVMYLLWKCEAMTTANCQMLVARVQEIYQVYSLGESLFSRIIYNSLLGWPTEIFISERFMVTLRLWPIASKPKELRSSEEPMLYYTGPGLLTYPELSRSKLSLLRLTQFDYRFRQIQW